MVLRCLEKVNYNFYHDLYHTIFNIKSTSKIKVLLTNYKMLAQNKRFNKKLPNCSIFIYHIASCTPSLILCITQMITDHMSPLEDMKCSWISNFISFYFDFA